jgi:hypothetical protein
MAAADPSHLEQGSDHANQAFETITLIDPAGNPQ